MLCTPIMHEKKNTIIYHEPWRAATVLSVYGKLCFLNVRQAKTHFPWLQRHLVVVIQDSNKLLNFSAGVTYIPNLVGFGVCSGSEKCSHLKQARSHSKNNNPVSE